MSASLGGAAWQRACRAGRGGLIADESRVLAVARLGVLFSEGEEEVGRLNGGQECSGCQPDGAGRVQGRVGQPCSCAQEAVGEARAGSRRDRVSRQSTQDLQTEGCEMWGASEGRARVHLQVLTLQFG